MSTPKVSVIVPTYNRVRSLSEALPTIINQSYPDFEIIVCDDASTDGTEAWVKSLHARQVRYLRNSENRGIYATFHHGISQCSGEYIAIFHDHDLYHPSIVEKCCALLDRYPSMSFVHTGLLNIDGANAVIGRDIRALPEVMKGTGFAHYLTQLTCSPVMAATAMVRKSAYDAVPPYSPDQYGLGCDMMMWFRLSLAGDVGYLAEPLALIRSRERGKGTAVFSWKEVEKHAEMLRELRESLFPEHVAAYLTRKVGLRLHNEKEWSRLIARAAILDQKILQEGVRLCMRHKAVAPVLCYAILKFMPGALTLARKSLLERHYQRRNEFIAREAIEAEMLLEECPDVREWVSGVSALA